MNDAEEKEFLLDPPTGMADIERIISIVEARLRVYLPNLVRGVLPDKTIIALKNPNNGRAIQLYHQFIPARDGAFGYRAWTLEAVPDLLRYLIGETEKETEQ